MNDTENTYNEKKDNQLAQSPVPVSKKHKQDDLQKINPLPSKKEKEPLEIRIREWGQVFINFCLLLAGVIAICIYGGQLEVMKGQAEKTQQSLDILRAQFAQEQRPYIVPGGFRIGSLTTEGAADFTRPEPGKVVLVSISFQNSGKSNAINLHTYRHVVFGDDGINNSHADPIILTGQSSEPPGKGSFTTAISMKNTYSSSSESFKVNQEELLAWNGKDAIYVFGAFTYFDKFGQYYCSPFRYQWLPGTNNWLNAEDFTDLKSKQDHTSDELCPKYGNKSGLR